MSKTFAVTETQISFIKTLQSERQVPKDLVESMRNVWRSGSFTEETANNYIQLLKTFPVIEENIERNLNLVGYHKINDAIIRVYRSKNDCMYMKQLILDEKGKYKFAVVSSKNSVFLNNSTKMSEEEVKNLEKNIKIHNVNVDYA